VQRAGALLKTPLLNDAVKLKLHQLSVALQRPGESAPPVVPARRMFELLRCEAEQTPEKQLRAILRCLTTLPISHHGNPARLAFLSHWNRLRGGTASERQNRLTRLVESFAGYLRDQPDQELALRPREPVWKMSQHGQSAQRADAAYDHVPGCIR
jgi:hypothetical protein